MNKWYKLRMLGNNHAEITIYNDIGAWGITAEMFKCDIENLTNVSEMTIRINSYGGEVFDGNAVYNLLREHKAYKTAIIDGVAASMASVIAMAADKIIMPENAWLMIHDPSTIIAGNATNLRSAADLLDGIKENAIKAYQRHAKDLSKDELWDLMSKESWINAKDAKTYGLIEEISDTVEAEEPITNTGRTVPENVKKIVFKVNKNGQKPKNKLEVNMKVCPHCGKEHVEGVVFCGHCGKPVDQITAARQKEIDEAVMVVKARAINISKVCANLGLSVEFAAELVASEDNFETCVMKASEKAKEKSPALPVSPDLKVVKDQADKFRMHATNSLQVALRVENAPEVVNEVRRNPGPRDLHGLVRACLLQEGRLSAQQVASLNPVDIGREAIRMAGMGTSDLPAILADTMNKTFAGGFNEAPSTFQVWCAETENTDFRAKSITKLSSFGDIDDIPEGANFKEGKFSDKKESITVSTKGKYISVSRNVIVNNDTSVLSEFPRAMGSAVRRRQNKDAYDLLTYNTLVGPVTTEDGVAIFDDTAHGNYKSSSGVPSVASIGIAEQKLMEMKLPKGTADMTQAYANIPGKYLITGTANKLTVQQVLGSPIDPAATYGKQVYNPYNNALIPVFDAYLQYLITAASKTYAWYLAADQGVMPTLTIAYLSGYRTPTLRSEPSAVGEALGIKYDIFYDWGFSFQDFRGIVLNDGAS